MSTCLIITPDLFMKLCDLVKFGNVESGFG